MLRINNLSGFSRGSLDAGSLSSVTSATFVGQLTDDGTITLPSGLSETDLIIYIENAVIEEGAPALAVPSGFTSCLNILGATDDTRTVVSYKIAEPSDSSLGISDAMNGNTVAQGYFVYRANAPINEVIASTPETNVTSGNPAAVVIPVAGNNPPVIALGFYKCASGGSVSPRTMSPAKDTEISVSFDYSPNTVYLASKLFNSDLVDVSVDMDDEGGQNVISGLYLQLT